VKEKKTKLVENITSLSKEMKEMETQLEILR